MTDYLTEIEAAEYLRTSRQTIRKFRKGGLIKSVKIPKNYIYKKTDLDDLFDKYNGKDLSSDHYQNFIKKSWSPYMISRSTRSKLIILRKRRKMNKYPQDLHNTVEKILVDYPETRDSDIKLYKVILKKFYGTVDLSMIDFDGDIFASIKRTRAKIQKENPYVKPSKEVKRKRHQMEEKFLDYARNW